MITTTLILTLYFSSLQAVMVQEPILTAVVQQPIAMVEGNNTEFVDLGGKEVNLVAGNYQQPKGAETTLSEYPTGFT